MPFGVKSMQKNKVPGLETKRKLNSLECASVFFAMLKPQTGETVLGKRFRCRRKRFKKGFPKFPKFPNALKRQFRGVMNARYNLIKMGIVSRAKKWGYLRRRKKMMNQVVYVDTCVGREVAILDPSSHRIEDAGLIGRIESRRKDVRPGCGGCVVGSSFVGAVC